MTIADELKERLRHIKLVSIDVDGVMTDGGIYLGAGGQELKRFHVRDGAGIVYLQRNGIRVVVITGRESEAVAARCREIGVSECRQGVKDKWAAVREILETQGLEPREAAHIGDDLLDLVILGKVGVSLTVADAAPEVRERADYTARARGGEGAVRELAEFILKAQDKWDDMIEEYMEG